MKLEWLKCDLHMHSHFSKTKDNGRVKEMSAQEYVDILMSKNIRIFSITDHNIFSNEYYLEIRDYISDKEIRIINGVEFDVYVNDNDYFQMGVYFDNNVDGAKLESIVFDLYDNKKPKFVDIINRLSILDCKFIVIPEGNKARGITKIMESIPLEEKSEISKYAMYKIFSAYDVKEKFNEKSKNIWAFDFFQKSTTFSNIIKNKTEEEILKINNEVNKKIKNVEYDIVQDDLKEIYNYIVKYGNYFAYFTFSDWHNSEEYNPQINNFIFGSLNFYFEAFEMAVLDPLSRIIKTADTEILIPPHILKSVEFDIDQKRKTIKFSPGLNVIIGKRGSGKSLLLTIIENLGNRNNDLNNKYKGLNINNVKAFDYNNICIDSGQLSSLAVLKQDQIVGIYENPNLANVSISSNFVEIEPYDLSRINIIIDIANKVIPYNKNYKNLTSIFISLKEVNYFLFKKYSDIQFDDIVSKFEKSISGIDTIIRDLKNIGLNPEVLKNERNVLKNLFDGYEFMLNSYKNTIDNHNERINRFILRRNVAQKMILEQNSNLDKIFSDITSNFDILLNLKKLEYILNNIKFDNPKLRKRRKGNYLFVTSYSIPEDLIENIWDKLTSSISKVKGDTSDIDLIRKYTNGEKNLKTGVVSLENDLVKYINTDVFKPLKGFYKIINEFTDQELETYKDLVDLISKNKLQDLSVASPGMKSVAYIDMLFDLNESILLFDQPEDNIDNEYISQTLVSIIKDKKKSKQLIFVTHNPSLAVYGDAFNYIYVENDGEIMYKNFFIEKVEDKNNIMRILEGGKSSFINRDMKYGNILGEEEHDFN